MIGEILITILGTVGFLLIFLFIYAISAMPLAGLLWFLGRKKADWMRREFLFILFPWVIWILLMFFAGTGRKSLSNIVELFYCGLAGGLILFPRIIFPARLKKTKLLITILSTLVATIIVMLIFYFTPALPE